ncbi:MAG TPA: phosphoribosyltransferase family protein [Chryseolinea sp.]
MRSYSSLTYGSVDKRSTMVLPNDALFQNRKHAAFLLAERLMDHANSDTIVVAVNGGGIHVGYHLAELLHLPLEVIPCKKIKHPADNERTIGAVSLDAVVIHDDDNTIPQDYIYHQIQLLQHVIKGQSNRYNVGRTPRSFKGRTIILADDLLITGDTMLATLKTIRKQSPEKIIVAVPNVTPEATRSIAPEIDEIIYLTIEPSHPVTENLYAEFPEVDDDEVIALLQKITEGYSIEADTDKLK